MKISQRTYTLGLLVSASKDILINVNSKQRYSPKTVEGHTENHTDKNPDKQTNNVTHIQHLLLIRLGLVNMS